MATFLINASNLKAGGGLQVADSICRQLDLFNIHHFIVVLSSYLQKTFEGIKEYGNVHVYYYNVPNALSTIIFGRDKFLDGLVEKHRVDGVLTVFGPSRWKPSVPHLCGFAIPHLLIPESPYFQNASWKLRLRWKMYGAIVKWSLKRSANVFWTENPFTSNRMEQLLKTKKVYTISNYYNQVFDHPNRWKQNIALTKFDGITCLSISSPYPHKNFGIIGDIIRYYRDKYPDFMVRFVLTCEKEDIPMSDDVIGNVVYVGKIDVTECPSLYEQSDLMFMPSLLECFSATYPEAMRMEKPIVTTDLEFAKGLCGDAACYYSAVNPRAAAEAIYRVANNKDYANQLVENGKKQLQRYDNYIQRAEKLIGILEDISR